MVNLDRYFDSVYPLFEKDAVKTTDEYSIFILLHPNQTDEILTNYTNMFLQRNLQQHLHESSRIVESSCRIKNITEQLCYIKANSDNRIPVNISILEEIELIE